MAEEYNKYTDPALATESAYAPGTTLGQGQDRVDTQNAELEAANREKLLASGEINADTPEFLQTEATNQATYGIGNPVFSAATTSDTAADEVDTQNSQVQSDLANTNEQLGFQTLTQPTYQEYADYTSEIEGARSGAKTNYQNIIETITKDFDNRKIDQENENRQTTGANSMQLARMKAFGTSVSGMNYLKQVEVQNQHEINKLLVQKAQALIAATSAYQSQDWTMLTAKIDESKSITDKHNQIQTWMFEDRMKTNDQLMEQSRFGWDAEDRAMGKMTEIAASGVAWDQLDTEEVASLEESAGVPSGYFKAVWDLQQYAIGNTKNLADVEYQQQLVNLLNDTPEGQKVKIGDKYYDGWDKSKDTWETTETDNYGNVTFISYDRETGEVKSTALGNIGSYSNGWTLQQVDGAYYRVNTNTGTAEAVRLEGGEIDPSYEPGFNQWAESMGTVTVEFGGATGFEGSHPGWDIAGNVGTPITPFQPGSVTAVDNTGAGGFGKWVEVTDSQGRRHRYSHMNSVDVQVGQQVGAGTVLGGMGNTGNVLTTRGTGKSHEPNAEERAAGYGSHLDYRVYTDGGQLTETTTSGAVEGMSTDEVTGVSEDMTALMNDTDAETKKTNYYAIRNQVTAFGNAALTWFDKAYPPENYGISKDEVSLPSIGEIKDTSEYSTKDIISIVERDTVTWDQLTANFGDFADFAPKDIIDIGFAAGATYDQIKDLLAEGGGIFGGNDRWDSTAWDYANKLYDHD